MWKLKQIFDGEYGCEERQPGEKEKCLVILANEEGEEKTFEANEDWIAAIEKLSANPLMKIIISKPMAKDCQNKKIVVEKKGAVTLRAIASKEAPDTVTEHNRK